MPKHIDDIFRNGLENHYVRPSAESWDRLDQSLSSKEGRVMLPWFYHPRKALIAAFVVSVLSFGGGYIYALLNDGSGVVAEKGTSKAELLSVQPNNTLAKDHLADEQTDIGTERSSTNTIEHYPINMHSLAAAEQDDDIDKYPSMHDKRVPIVPMVVSEAKVSETPVVMVTINSDKGLTELNERESASLDKVAISSILQTRSLLGPCTVNSIETPIFSGRTANRFLEFSFGSTGQSSGFYVGEKSPLEIHSEHWSSYDNYNVALRFGKYFHRNFGGYIGLQLNQSSFMSSNSLVKLNSVGQNNIDYPDGLSVVRYGAQYSFMSIDVPMAARLKGRLGRLGYHSDFGIALTSGMSQKRNFDVSDATFTWLSSEMREQEFDMSLGLQGFTRFGIDYYLFTNGGLSFDAILRKRLTASDVGHSLNGQNSSLGASVGLFRNF